MYVHSGSGKQHIASIRNSPASRQRQINPSSPVLTSGLLRAGIRFLTTTYQPEATFISFTEGISRCIHECTSQSSAITRRSDVSGDVSHPLPHVQRDRCQSWVPAGSVSTSDYYLLYDTVNTIGTLIELSLTDSTRHKFRTALGGDEGILSTDEANGTIAIETNWPSGPEDLLPFGIENSAYGLQFWARMYVPSILRLVGALACFYAPFSKLLIKPGTPHPFVTNRPTEYLNHVIQDYDLLQSRSPTRPPVLSIQVTYHFQCSIGSVADLFDYMLRSESGVLPRIIYRFCGQTLYESLNRTFKIMENSRNDGHLYEHFFIMTSLHPVVHIPRKQN